MTETNDETTFHTLARLATWQRLQRTRSVEINCRHSDIYGPTWTVKLLPGVVCHGRAKHSREADTEPGMRSRFLSFPDRPTTLIEVVAHALALYEELFPDGTE